MRSKVLMATILLTSLAHAREPKRYLSGVLLQMDSVECGVDEKSGKSFVGEMVGTDSAHQKKKTLLCQEYLLQTDRMIYRIRPNDEKHPVLLPVGEKVQFRLDKDKMRLRSEDLDDKERDYTVVSITLRSESRSSGESAEVSHK